MGRLKDFDKYLRGRHKVAEQVEKRLCSLQEKYETFFQEINQVRERELSQLTAHILAARDGSGPPLPADFNEDLEVAKGEVAKEFEAKMRRLRSDLHELQRKAEQTRKKSVRAERSIRGHNTSLDSEEEALKVRSADLLSRINDYNERIRELGRGFGFFANLFQMHRLRAERRLLDEEQGDVAARIEALRVRWETSEQKHTQREKSYRKSWVEQQADAAAMAAKVQHLADSAPAIRLRSTVEWVLFEQKVSIGAAKQGDPACPRCKSGNPASNHFCHICAQRLVEDRPDFAGSIVEIAELNHHHNRFSLGMQACQELIGLVRGLASGIEAFRKSVGDVIDSENKYPLPKLEITVPRFAVEYGQSFDALLTTVKTDLSLHPDAFARKVKTLVDDVFTEEKIKNYFEMMGGELSAQAGRQW